MNKDSENASLLNAMKASIRNHEFCTEREEKKRNLSYKIKYISWYILMIFISPYTKITGDTMVCAMTPVNEKRLKNYTENGVMFRFAKLNSSFFQMQRNVSVLSSLSLKRRLSVSLNAIRFYKRNKKDLKGYLHFVLEYYSIYNFLKEKQVTAIVSPCMYDRYCTYLSYLGHAYGVKLIGIQDGAAIDIKVPCKIYCTQMYCFDKFEGDIIRRFILNDDCEYIYVGFSSVLEWEDIDRNGKYVIAVASQDWYTRKTLALLKCFLKECDSKKYTIVVFPHYRERAEQYDELKSEFPELIIKTGKRYRNVDLLVTFYSTIVFDFWSVNPDLNVKCLKIEGYEPSYYRRPNVSVYEKDSELVGSIISENSDKCEE